MAGRGAAESINKDRRLIRIFMAIAGHRFIVPESFAHLLAKLFFLNMASTSWLFAKHMGRKMRIVVGRGIPPRIEEVEKDFTTPGPAAVCHAVVLAGMA
jgi:hypothetical protein